MSKKGGEANLKKEKIKVACDNCGEIIEKRPWEIKNHKHHFCNSTCKAKWQSKYVKGGKHPSWKEKIKVHCDSCGEIIEKRPCDIKRDEHHFCNAKCRGEGRSKYLGGKNGSRWNGGKVKLTCDNCGKIIEKHPCDVRRSKYHFCNRKCQGEWMSNNKRGKNSPFWKGGLVKRTCETCGTEFPVKRGAIKKGGGRYCNLSCSRKGKKIPTHHTKPELIFEAICKKYRLPFKYTGDGQLWIGKKGGKKLNPDFIECNGNKIVVEVMGAYWHSLLLNSKIREDALLPYREKHYKRYKWQPIFIWDTDLLRKDAEQFVLSTLKREGIIKTIDDQLLECPTIK